MIKICNMIMKLLISFTTYPRNGTTPELLKNTFNSLFNNVDLTNIIIRIIVVGDDYANIDELKPIFKDFDTEFYNININNALRNYDIANEIKWKQAVQRSKIFILEKALTYDFDYIMMSSDDDIYINNKLSESINYLEKYKPDFLFNQGYYINNKIIPCNINISYPLPGKCISSGCIYNLRNIQFINTIIDFRKQKWDEVMSVCNKQHIYRIRAEDYQLWEYMIPFFKSKKFTSVLIPKVLISHDTEMTLFNYL